MKKNKLYEVTVVSANASSKSSTYVATNSPEEIFSAFGDDIVSVIRVGDCIVDLGKENIQTKKQDLIVQQLIQEYIKNGMVGNLDLEKEPVEYLPDNLTRVGGYLDLSYTPIQKLPDNLEVGGHLYLFDTPVQKLPDNLKIGGDLNLRNTPIQKLPDNLKVGGDLWLSNTHIQKLPDNLEVSGTLELNNTPIQELPDNLKVGGNLYLYSTPISKKYNFYQLKQMYSGVKGKIYA